MLVSGLVVVSITKGKRVTLILNVATPDHIFQVGDRRLTRLSDGSLIDDDTNKAVFFCGRLAISYTGLAQIDGTRTDLWLTKVLADAKCVTLSDATAEIQTRATEAFRRIPLTSEQKRHAFVGVGWTKLSEEEPYHPFVCYISNYHDDEGKRTKRALEKFGLKYQILFGLGQHTFLDIGASLSKEQYNRCFRTLRKATERKVTPQTIINILADTIRQVSRSQRTVGGELLAVVIPKASVETDSRYKGSIFSQYSSNEASFMYMPSTSTKSIVYGPNMVCNGGSVIGATGGSSTGNPNIGFLMINRQSGDD